MTKRKIKFLPVFLIACLCLVASLGFASVNAFAYNGESAHNGDYKVTFTVNHLNFGKIEGQKDYVFQDDDAILTRADDPTLKIVKFRSMTATEIKAVPSEYYSFDHWTRSDGKELNDEITSDVEFIAHFKSEYTTIKVDLITLPEDAGLWTVPIGSTWHLDYSGRGWLNKIQVIYKDKIVASFRVVKYNQLIPVCSGTDITEGAVILSPSDLYLRDPHPWPQSLNNF